MKSERLSKGRKTAKGHKWEEVVESHDQPCPDDMEVVIEGGWSWGERNANSNISHISTFGKNLHCNLNLHTYIYACMYLF